MPTNDFLPIGIASDANVATQSDYVAWSRRLAGFLTGIVPSPLFNKILRQSSWISSGLAQWIVDTNNADLLDDGNYANLKAALIAAINNSVTSRLLGPPIDFGTPGVYSYTPVSPLTKYFEAEFVGGGGGGAGSPISGTAWSGSGGGAGGAGRIRVQHTPGRAYAITIGAFGLKGQGGNSGGNGGTTSLDTICSATGGYGGTANGAGGAGGMTYGADIAFVGGPGMDGIVSSSGVSNGLFFGTGKGASSIYGDGGTAGSLTNSTVSPTYGAGGGGAYGANNRPGGQGGGGFMRIREYS